MPCLPKWQPAWTRNCRNCSGYRRRSRRCFHRRPRAVLPSHSAFTLLEPDPHLSAAGRDWLPEAAWRIRRSARPRRPAAARPRPRRLFARRSLPRRCPRRRPPHVASCPHRRGRHRTRLPRRLRPRSAISAPACSKPEPTSPRPAPPPKPVPCAIPTGATSPAASNAPPSTAA